MKINLNDSVVAQIEVTKGYACLTLKRHYQDGSVGVLTRPCETDSNPAIQASNVQRDYEAMCSFFKPEHYANLQLMREIGFEPMFVEQNLHTIKKDNIHEYL